MAYLNGLTEIGFELGFIYVMDRGYIDLARLDCIHPARVFYPGEPRAVDDASHLRCD